MLRLHRVALAVTLAFVLPVAAARAAIVVLEVDSALSILTLSGDALGLPFAEQVPGALVTRYAGSITADLSNGVFTFSGGSAISALLNPAGPFTTAPNPIGTEVGNYGVTATGLIDGIGEATLNGAYRDVIFDITAGTATNAAATAATFSLASTFLDYGTTFGANDTDNLAGRSDANDSIANVIWDGTTLTIPVDIAIPNGDGNVTQRWTGNIVAVAVPEPSSFALLSLVGAVGFCRRRKHR